MYTQCLHTLYTNTLADFRVQLERPPVSIRRSSRLAQWPLYNILHLKVNYYCTYTHVNTKKKNEYYYNKKKKK